MNKNRLCICILSFFLLSCTNPKEKNYDISQSKKNQYFSSQAEVIFGVVLRDKMSFSSYSADDVSYSINENDFNYNIFIKDKELVLKKNGWIFLKKYKQSYIFCNKNDQLEIITPRKIAKNDVLTKRSIGMQLEESWNILFSHPKNSTQFECNNLI